MEYLTCLAYAHLYRDKNINPTWTPIEPQTKEILIGKNKTHLITRIQSPIQLAATRTVHRSQRLSLDEMTFDPSDINKHVLSYVALSRIRTKKIIFTTSCNELLLSHC